MYPMDVIAGKDGTVFSGKVCLDLFAGTGAMGIEALSRGAESCVFVEAHPSAANALEGNIDRIVLAESSSIGAYHSATARVARSDWRLALRKIKQQFDVAFVDPPYGAGYYDEVMKTFLDYDIISDGGFAALEREVTTKDHCETTGRKTHSNGRSIVNSIGEISRSVRYEGFDIIRERRYGKTLIEIYVRTDREP
jgi:16S rRNA (guanine(966)-N(2))-methyltransferase RsmD